MQALVRVRPYLASGPGKPAAEQPEAEKEDQKAVNTGAAVQEPEPATADAPAAAAAAEAVLPQQPEGVAEPGPPAAVEGNHTCVH